jgi:hypothetical protein
MRYAARGILLGLTSLILVWPVGCQQSESDEEPEPAPQAPVEIGIRLTGEAKTSIGMATAPVHFKSVASRISTTGWLVIKPGHEVTVKAMRPVSSFQKKEKC